MISFLDCPHNRIQQYTETCLDCGYNTYTTDEEYLEDLRNQAKETETRKEIRRLEKKLKRK
jgi:hypothetical protein